MSVRIHGKCKGKMEKMYKQQKVYPNGKFPFNLHHSKITLLLGMLRSLPVLEEKKAVLCLTAQGSATTLRAGRRAGQQTATSDWRGGVNTLTFRT